MLMVIIFLVFILVLVGGVICLQIFLSKASNKLLGLILPAICLMFSLIIIFSNVLFMVDTGISTTETRTETVEGIVISEEIIDIDIESEKPNILASLGIILVFFLILNIPTIILFTIYFISREKLNVRYQLDKMNIQDLE